MFELVLLAPFDAMKRSGTLSLSLLLLLLAVLPPVHSPINDLIIGGLVIRSTEQGRERGEALAHESEPHGRYVSSCQLGRSFCTADE
jgi:hypothetical protein